MAGKTYDLVFLTDSTGIVLEKGLESSGSQRVYFEKLESFESGVRQILDTLTDLVGKRAKRELVTPLKSLQDKLARIAEEKLSGTIDEFVTVTLQAEDDAIVYAKIREIIKATNNLCKDIRESEAFGSTPAEDERDAEPEARKRGEPQTETANVAGTTGSPKPSASPGSRLKARPRAVFFSGLLAAIERFERDAALHEIRTLANFSYDEEIDGMLEGISEVLTGFNYREALSLAKDMLMYVASLEREAKGGFSKKKILAIDDVPDVLNTLKTMLGCEYNVYCVTHHTAAIKFLSNNTPDLILLDIEMPEMDGFELLKIIRRMSSCRRTPVVFLTGNVSVENVKTSVELGGNDFIKKPVDFEVLTAKLRKHLGT